MMLKAAIIEQVENDGSLRTFVMQPGESGGHITVALPNEYAERRDSPFHFLDPADEIRFREGFARCRARRLGAQNFRQSGDSITLRSLQWSGIPTAQYHLSYYTLAFPEFAIPTRLSVTDPHHPGREYRRQVIRDDERNRWAVYLECASSLGRFDFVLAADLQLNRDGFSDSAYADPETQDGYGVTDHWRHFLPNGEVDKVQHFFAERIHIGDVRLNQSTRIEGPIINSAFAAHSPNAIQTITVNPDIQKILRQIMAIAETDNLVTKTEYAAIIKGIEDLRAEFGQARPRQSSIERIIGNLGSIASIASLVGQISPLLPIFH